MILDKIDNWNMYFRKESILYDGMRFILEEFNENIRDGRYEIKGNDIYAMVQSYSTEAPETKKFESHKQYIDVQYIVSGRELMGWLPVYELETMTTYSEEKDVVFYHPKEGISQLVLMPGMFAVFYPADAHRPCCFFDEPEQVRKIVVKVRV